MWASEALLALVLVRVGAIQAGSRPYIQSDAYVMSRPALAGPTECAEDSESSGLTVAVSLSASGFTSSSTPRFIHSSILIPLHEIPPAISSQFSALLEV